MNVESQATAFEKLLFQMVDAENNEKTEGAQGGKFAVGGANRPMRVRREKTVLSVRAGE